MRPVPVVSVQPDRQRSGAVIRGGVGLSVGPFAQGGLDEALGFAVCLGRIGLGPDVLEAEIAAGAAEGLGAIAGTIVGHHTGNRDAEVRVVGDRGPEEGDRALLFLVRKDLREGDPGGVVDADVDELVWGFFCQALLLRFLVFIWFDLIATTGRTWWGQL